MRAPPTELSASLLTAITAEGRQLRVRPDEEGWIDLQELASVLTLTTGRPVTRDAILHASRGVPVSECNGTAIRLRSAGRRRRGWVPDILFHATTADQVARLKPGQDLNASRGRQLFLSPDEAQAWRAAHRLRGEPIVLAVDTLRARRAGYRFHRGRNHGLYTAGRIPTRHVLNLRDGFDVQLSAGGVPVRQGPDGQLQMALVQVVRRSGVTWEVAKGKLEPGETPEAAAEREVGEELGVEVPLRVIRSIGEVRYGFLAPGGMPRLKTIYLYFLQAESPLTRFAPAHAEGIGAVGWFSAERACQIVTHTSLQPLMKRAKDLALRYGVTPDPQLVPPSR